MRQSRPIDDWMMWFAVFDDRSRLTLIAQDGPILVADLAAANGLKSTTMLHSLRLLRVHEMVQTERDGKTVLYRAAPHPVIDLLDHVIDTEPEHQGVAR